MCVCVLLCGVYVKVFSVDLSSFCRAELYGSPGYCRSQNRKDVPGSSISSRTAIPPLIPYATLAPVSSGVTAPSVSVTRGAPSNEYRLWLETIMVETWLRAGRTDLVDSLCRESPGLSTSRPGVATADGGGDGGSAPALDDGRRATEEGFATMHQFLHDLKKRNIDTCLKWIIKEQGIVKHEIRDLEDRMSEDAAVASAQPHSASADTAGGQTNTRGGIRKRVSFSQEDDEIDESHRSRRSTQTTTTTTELTSTSTSSIHPHSSSSMHLTSTLASLQSQQGALHTLQFDCHRLKFLQILIDSEEETRTSRATTKRQHHRKRKHQGTTQHATTTNDGDNETRTIDEDVDMLGEESAAMAADETSSDEDLNSIARGDSGGATGGESVNPTSFSHHAALKYAQTFFPSFADTRMDDIRRLSGCLLFLGHLTSSNSNHPYVTFFTRDGNSSLWSDVARRARNICLARMKKPTIDPMVVTLRACDIALPQLVKYHAIMRLNQDMVTAGAIPEIDLGAAFQFHSTFICPVSKEQCSTTATLEELMEAAATIQSPSLTYHGPTGTVIFSPHHNGIGITLGGEHDIPMPLPIAHPNPPVMLKCGHCISYLAMDKIVRGLRLSRSRERKTRTTMTHHSE